VTNDEEIRRGHEAARLMEEPLLKAAFEGIEASIFDAMRRCKVSDTVTQHELVLMLQLHGRLRSVFREHMETGELARIQKETLASKAKRLIRRVR
jgi:hypothetical protein